MVRNPSNSQRTIKQEMVTIPSDMWTIDKLTKLVNYTGFILPDIIILDDYRDYFEQYLVTIPLEERYHYSPTLFAQEYYGTPDLDFLVLYFTKANTVFEFNTETINVLPIDRLQDINRLIVHVKNEISLNNLNPPVYEPFDDITPTEKAYDYPSLIRNDLVVVNRVQGVVDNYATNLDEIIAKKESLVTEIVKEIKPTRGTTRNIGTTTKSLARL